MIGRQSPYKDLFIWLGSYMINNPAFNYYGDLLLQVWFFLGKRERCEKVSSLWLPFVVEKRFPDLVYILLNYDIDVNARDNLGNTALHWAAQWGYLDIVKELSKHGADPNAVNYQ